MSNISQRRYNLRAAMMMVSYVLVLVAVSQFFRHGPAPGDSPVVLAILSVLPALPIVGVFALMGRYLVEERDEYRRMLHVRQVLVATAIALSAATVWGFAESFGQAPHLDSYWVAIVWFAGLGVGALVNRIAERPAA